MAAVQTNAAQNGAAPPVADDPKKDVNVTPGLLRVEEKIEYRDEAGNLLDEAQVKALEGKVSFSTKYETRTRLVDDAGNELVDIEAANEVPEESSFAGTLAEAEEPSTDFEGKASGAPPKVNVAEDLKKESAVESSVASSQQAEPASDTTAATAHEEL